MAIRTVFLESVQARVTIHSIEEVCNAQFFEKYEAQVSCELLKFVLKILGCAILKSAQK